MPREKSAGAVIFRKENNEIYYLLLHYESGHWDFPKGHIEKGEKEEETVKREVAEETGIKDIEIIKGFKEWIKYTFRQTYGLKEEEKTRLRQGYGGQGKKAPCPHTKRGQSAEGAKNNEVSPRSGVRAWVFKIVTFYLAETKTKEVKISFEHLGYKWLSYEQALERVTFKKAKEILKKAHHYLINYV